MVDYKEGIFKYTSTLHLNKASHETVQIPIRAPEEAKLITKVVRKIRLKFPMIFHNEKYVYWH
jgi:hypothetical protein